MIKILVKTLVPIMVLVVCGAAGYQLIKTAPKTNRHTPKPVLPVVETMVVKKEDYRVKIASRGVVKPRTQSMLVSEVAGRIIRITPDLRNGGFISLDQVLVAVDPAEYRLLVDTIEAALLHVEARLAELEISSNNLQKSLLIETRQLALAAKRYRRHSKLQQQGTIAQTTLEQTEQEHLLRRASLQSLKNTQALIPAQRRALQADKKLKQVELASARLNLEHTRIRAPYSGRVLEKMVDLGQSVAKGTPLASIYADDFVEIRLPITAAQAAYLQLSPASLAQSSPASKPLVTLVAAAGSQQQWQGNIVRTEASVDSSTRQQFLVAQVDLAKARSDDNPALLMSGQFVEAEIQGRILHDVFILPRNTVRAADIVLLVTPELTLERRKIEVLWRDLKYVVAQNGLEPGDRISLTALPYAPDGAPLRLDPAQTAANNEANLSAAGAD